MKLGGRGARNAGIAIGFKNRSGFFSRREPCHRHGRLHYHMRRGLRDGDVPDLANLAVLLAASVRMPMAGGVKGQSAHGEDQGHRQHTH